ncbi:hypothetical protein F441_23144 [Phytophthora nicotianae CJ01A1]|uniref:Uncharacterized protein n=1 Tax=Phytophthora nicotianae CJ01A1 TaxID=1317063 RepID=W2VP47_PHYNI|nr:hypothetical protein F441_23144 [Phytophthora nicotianae CJ01A1]
MTEADRSIYLAPGEAPPHRTVQSKRFITKVMFMAAVMRPVFAEDGSLIFDGKLGMWPFTERVPAKKSSRNRPAGTLITKAVNVGRREQRAMLIDNVIPAIKMKCPAFLKGVPLIIQQDGARCHVEPNDPAILAACRADGWDICIEMQPPNSPDTNILDLGYFCSIQALQYEESPNSIDELNECTIASYQNLQPETLEDTFVSLQKVMECIIQDLGNNNYKRPHIGKSKLRKAGLLLKNYKCDMSIYLVVGLGVEGEQSYEEEIPVRFQLNMFRGKSKNTFSNKLKEDLIQWFGPVQYADASEEYLGTLQKIAAVTGVKTAVDVKVPVKMYCSAIVSDLATISGDMKPLKDI